MTLAMAIGKNNTHTSFKACGVETDFELLLKQI